MYYRVINPSKYEAGVEDMYIRAGDVCLFEMLADKVYVLTSGGDYYSVETDPSTVKPMLYETSAIHAVSYTRPPRD